MVKDCFLSGLCLHSWYMEMQINDSDVLKALRQKMNYDESDRVHTYTWCESLPAIFQQSGVNSGLLIQQLPCIPLPPVLPLGFVHFLENSTVFILGIGIYVQYKNKVIHNTPISWRTYQKIACSYCFWTYSISSLNNSYMLLLFSIK